MDHLEETLSILKKVELFSSLDDQSLKLLRDKMKLVSFKPEEIICSEGEIGDCMYIVESGEVRVLKKGKEGSIVVITVLGRGEVAGVMSLFEEETRSATLQAAGKVELWEIDKITFQNLLQTYPGISKALLAALSRYLRRETEIVTELRSRDEDNRLKIAVFDSKPYFEQAFKDQNRDRYALRFFDVRLGRDTVRMASDFKVICVFVNDRIDADVARELSEMGVEMIALRCAGYNNIDLKACEQYGLSVARVPAYSPYAVAEHSIALIMALNRHIHRAHNRVRDGNFSLDNLVGFDIHGKTIGVIGTGRIGTCAINILLGFGCSILAFDKFPDKQLAQKDYLRYTELDEIFQKSDIICLYAPLTNETHHMINEESIMKMKPGVMLINTSRGGLIDSRALIKGLVSGQIGSAGLDVYEEEEGYFYEDYSHTVIVDEILSRLTSFNNVMITSHMAFLTREALINIADTTFQNISEFESGKRRELLTNAISTT